MSAYFIIRWETGTGGRGEKWQLVGGIDWGGLIDRVEESDKVEVELTNTQLTCLGNKNI